MTIRLVTTSALCTLLAVWAVSGPERHPAIERAAALLGERWYELSFEGEHLGYWHTSSYRDPEGRWVFESVQRSSLKPGDPVTVSNRRVFSAQPPYDLEQAEYRESRRNSWEGTEIVRGSEGYLGTFQQAGAAPSRAVPLSWNYSLLDYLDFEAWLHEAERTVGSVRTIATLDFSRMQVVSRKLSVTGRGKHGYQIENPAPHANTTIELDAAYAPREIRLAGLFDLRRASREAALAPRSALQRASYYVPVDRPLTNHTRIETLDLAVSASVPVDEIWPASERQDEEWRLLLSANPLSGRRGADDSAEALGFPSRNPKIRALARHAVGDARTIPEQVDALVDFVHEYLSYEPGIAAVPVLELLERPVGDCTEYADLLTTLARSLDIPAHTVFGLAYAEGSEPAFDFHAWNEVLVDGAWYPVDPTWNQLQVDATHIPLPASDSAAMMLLTGTVDLRFELRDVSYFD